MNELQTLVEAIQNLANIEGEEISDESMKLVLERVDAQFTPEIILQSTNQIIKNMEDQGLNKEQAKQAIDALCETMKQMIYGEKQFTGRIKELIDTVVDRIFSIFYQALEKYHSYAIELPMTLEDSAIVPTYAHDSDAAADLYAADDVTVAPHTQSNMIRTGVHIQLPEGWAAFILPRSSIGAKTPLRLSNSMGVIDSGYRGPLGVLYDNMSDNTYEIHKGDRIAQLLVMPSYRFKAKVVDTLEDSDRGQTGFGDSGK